MLLRDVVYQAIRRAILTCELQPGRDFEELTLAEQYRVSCSPVRDALHRLELERLVTVLPRQGYRVNAILRSDVEEIFGLRLLIQPVIAAAAAAADDSALQLLDRFRSVADEGEVAPAYADFHESAHRAIVDLSRNMRLAAIAVGLIEQSARLLRAAPHTVDYERAVRHRFAEQEAWIDALQAHDPVRAARLSREHLRNTQGQVSAVLSFAGE